jgi:hypothetical protein
MAPSFGGLAEKAKGCVDIISIYAAQAAGALFGVIQGVRFVIGTMLGGVWQLKTPSGRRQIYYGRHGPAQGSETFEGEC